MKALSSYDSGPLLAQPPNPRPRTGHASRGGVFFPLCCHRLLLPHGSSALSQHAGFPCVIVACLLHRVAQAHDLSILGADFGGDTALLRLRERCNKKGLRLMVDFVPNHMAVDHPWTKDRPELLIQGSENSLKHSPQNFFKVQALVDGQNCPLRRSSRSPISQSEC